MGMAARHTLYLYLWSAAGALAAAVAVQGQTIPAFSGADGAARNVSGGRGGIVYHVTKLNSAIDDPQRDSFGTIRYGLNSANFPAGVPRTIVFDVGGVFSLGRLPQAGWNPNGNGWDPQSRLTIGGANVTLAGQTAPGAGVIFMGGGLKPQGNNNIIRNITVAAGYGLTGWWKPGDPFPSPPGPTSDASQWFPDNTVYDAMDISGTNLMIDHVSTIYATDETISMNEVANNITVQYSNIAQGQNFPQWDAEGGGLTGHAGGKVGVSQPVTNSARIVPQRIVDC
jgi:pectate lyase